MHQYLVPFHGLSIATNLASVWAWTEGCSLYSLLRSESQPYSILYTQPITLAMLVDIAIQIAEAMAYLHKNQLLHLSLTSHNILITVDGTVKVCDYGLERVKQHLRCIGYPNRIHYSSPEMLLVCTDGIATRFSWRYVTD
jgi:serine/threonine protein kinase